MQWGTTPLHADKPCVRASGREGGREFWRVDGTKATFRREEKL